MKIIISPHSGFCFGVKEAINKAEKYAEKLRDSETQLYSYGPLIHNSMVTKDLEEKGIKIISTLDDTKWGDYVIIRSHGIGEKFYHEARIRDLEIIDATCPYVRHIHNIVKSAFENGKQIIILGDENHPEIIGVNGWCKESAIIIKNKSEVNQEVLEKLKTRESFLVVQTTMKEETLKDVLDFFEEENIKVEINNTICKATKERQEGVLKTAEQVDVLLVIGDEKSSNTKKLYEIGQKYCKKTIFIKDIQKFSLKDYEKYNKIGVAAGASTPENAIKEVITSMSEEFTKGQSMADFMEEIEKSLRLPRSGELVTGTVHQVTDDYVIVNLGIKKDGIIPKSEVVLEEGQSLNDLFKEGDEIDVKVLKPDDGDGTIRLSRKKLAIGENWKELEAAYDNKETIEVLVEKKVNGGVIALYKEVKGFIPLSQLSDKYVEDASEFLGQTLEVKVSRVDVRKSKAVFSRKLKVLEERQKILEEIWETISEGDIVEGKVMRFTDYGAFVDIGGIDGLLHISEISWGKLKHPKEVLELGETVQVKILSMNSEKGKISLGLKQTVPEPWSVIDENYEIGGIVEGKVVQIKEYGCFVEIEPGLDGLVHISEVGHHRVDDIKNELELGQEVQAKILEIDKERKRISLSIKSTTEKPEMPEENLETEVVETEAEEVKVEATEEA